MVDPLPLWNNVMCTQKSTWENGVSWWFVQASHTSIQLQQPPGSAVGVRRCFFGQKFDRHFSMYNCRFLSFKSCQRHYQLLRYCCLVVECCFVGWSVGNLSFIWRVKDLFRCHYRSTHPSSAPLAFLQSVEAHQSCSKTVPPLWICNFARDGNVENWHYTLKWQCEWG